MAESWGRVGLFLCPILALRTTTYKGYTGTKGRGWNICRPANCLDCITVSVKLGTRTPGEGKLTEECRKEGEAGWLPQHLVPTLPSASRTVREMQ